MTVESATMYFATCDYPGCEVKSSDYEKGNGYLFDSPKDIAKNFEQWDGGLEDWGWLSTEDNHYCGAHTEWDEDGDRRVAKKPVEDELYRNHPEARSNG